MAGTQIFTDAQDQQVRGLLSGNASKLNEGLIALDKTLRRPLCGWLRAHFPGLSSEDLRDTWVEVLADVFRAVQAGRLDLRKPLLPWLRTALRRQALDRVRRHTTQERALTAVGDTLRGTRAGQYWSKQGTLAKHEFQVQTQLAIATLPPRQRLVWQVFADGYPDTTDLAVLRDRVSAVTGHPETRAAIKRALQEGRAKVRALLSEKGYTPDDEFALGDEVEP